jgi:hypothetical protein
MGMRGIRVVRGWFVLCVASALAGCSGPSLSETLADWFGSGEDSKGLEGLEPVTDEVAWAGSEGSISSEALRDDLPQGPDSPFDACVANLTIVGEHCGCMVNRASDAGLSDKDLAQLFTGDSSGADPADAARFTRIVRGCANYEVNLEGVPAEAPGSGVEPAMQADVVAAEASERIAAPAPPPARKPAPPARRAASVSAPQPQERRAPSVPRAPVRQPVAASAPARAAPQPARRPQPTPTPAPLPRRAAPAGTDGPLLGPLRPQSAPTPPPLSHGSAGRLPVSALG